MMPLGGKQALLQNQTKSELLLKSTSLKRMAAHSVSLVICVMRCKLVCSQISRQRVGCERKDHSCHHPTEQSDKKENKNKNERK